MLQVTRREALLLALAASAGGGRPVLAAAGDDEAVFWLFDAPGSPQSVIFGYERIAASLVPDIVNEGVKRVTDAKRVVQDFHSAVSLPAMHIDRSQMPPILGKLDEKTAGALRQAIEKNFPQVAGQLGQMTGIEATMLLMAEGQTPPNPTVGGTIFEHAQQLGRPSMVLIADDQLSSLYVAPDLAALNGKIGQDTIAYMLGLRDEDGPIGRHFEQLYASRKAGEIHRLGAELDKHGIFTPSRLLQTDKLKQLLADKVEATLKAKDMASAFVLMPLDTLTGGDGIVAALRGRGNTVTAVA
jgi:hypothetical protein